MFIEVTSAYSKMRRLINSSHITAIWEIERGTRVVIQNGAMEVITISEPYEEIKKKLLGEDSAEEGVIRKIGFILNKRRKEVEDEKGE